MNVSEMETSAIDMGVVPIAEKLYERRLWWYGNVIRANENSFVKVDLNIEVDSGQPKGRPKQQWLDSLDGVCI